MTKGNENSHPGASSCNPATGELFDHFPYMDDAALDSALSAAAAAFRTWRRCPVEERAQLLVRVAQGLRSNAEAIARDVTLEMGKPITQARAEVEKCAVLCDYFAEAGPRLLADEPTEIPGDKAYVAYRPLGPVLAIMPWNFPLWQAMRGAVPILLAGNSFILKPAHNVTRCARNLGAVFAEAGVPQGVFTVLTISNEQASGIVQDRRIAAVTLTGGPGAGSTVAALAGAALKKSVLELGGSDPFIVLADADIERAAQAATYGRFQNTGQICIAAKRIIVEAGVYDRFLDAFLACVDALPMGDPLDDKTYIGPMADLTGRDRVDAQVKASLAAGARAVRPGGPVEGAGAFYDPTVLVDVRPGMKSFDEEVFGPAASIISAPDPETAVALANNSDYGLSGALWTADAERAQRIAADLETGGVFINGYPASDPRTPIGGIKRSGYGRELSHFGLREFTNAQLVWRDRE